MKRIDLAIIGGVAAVAVILLLALRAPAGVAGTCVIVYVNDAEYARLPLGTPTVVTIDQGGGKVNVVEVFAGGVRMQSSTCRNQLCVLQGDVTEESAAHAALANWIVCLPNGVSVALVPEDGSGEVSP